MARPSWRKIEAALERIARAYHLVLDRDVDGNVIADDWNLTDLAKDLAEELET